MRTGKRGSVAAAMSTSTHRAERPRSPSSWLRSTAGIALVASGGLFYGACGDDGGGAGGNTPTTAPATQASTSEMASSSTGVAFSCEACSGSTPVCVDDALCAATCPLNRAKCPSGPDGSLGCCAAGETCCAPGGAALTGPGTCVPAGQGCPVFCPDGSTCNTNELCRLDPPTNTYDCVDDCDAIHTCGDGICCPLGTQCENGQCPLPDISIDEAMLTASVDFYNREFSESSCSIVEGCVDGPGNRRLLRFDLGTPNTGDGDLFLGNPQLNADLFEYSSCHDHFHFTSYARYKLTDQAGAVIATGHKQAFCLLDFEPLNGQAGDERYTCLFQGIQKDWMDIYSHDLPCQWVDITGVPPGDYNLEIELNFDRKLAEKDYTNNAATIPVTIPPDTCPGGCGPEWDDGCCAEGDPCGWGQNQRCDCAGFFDWDAVECGGCSGCTERTSCEGGCAPVDAACCNAGNTCGKDGDGVCDCNGQFAWDDADCDRCISADPECDTLTVDSCPQGCFDPANDPCCAADDPCGYAADGACDCGQRFAWDAMDCSSCNDCN